MLNTSNRYLIPLAIAVASLLSAACGSSRDSRGPSGGEGEGEGEGAAEGEGEGAAEGEGEGGNLKNIGESCASHNECKSLNCSGGRCAEQLPDKCESRCDCEYPQICDAASGDCMGAPAECNGNSTCPCGELCKLSKCVPGCDNNEDCGRDRVCKPVAELKNACFFACGADYPCPRDADGGELYDCMSGACVPRVQYCAECNEDTECGGLTDVCYDFGDIGKFCTKDCELDPNSCAEGFRCLELEREVGERIETVRQCVPRVGDCTSACRFVGCPERDKPFCHQDTGKCLAQFQACDPCTEHEQCGEEMRCKGYRPGHHCLQPCPGGASDCGDPSIWRCDTQAGAWCVPLTGTCDRCQGRECPILAPYCHPGNGQCVECLSNVDCPEGEACGQDTSLCVAGRLACGEPDPEEPGGGLCVEEAPYCYENLCVRCITDADCRCPAENPGCNEVCHHFRCVGDDFCQQVTCPEGTNCIPEARRCVQGGRCEKDETCGAGRLCDGERQICYYSDASCYTNADCPNNLVCDLDLHLCVGCLDNSMCRLRQICVPLGDGRRVCRQG